jgi:hypothetical protein
MDEEMVSHVDSDPREVIQIRNTGIFATEAEVEALKLSLRTSGHDVCERVNFLALYHGLPTTPEGYGMNLETREFLALVK